MSVKKVLLTVLIFVIAAFVVPLVLLLMLVNSENISVYVLVFGISFYASIGLIIALILGLRKEFMDAVEEIKVQNAAIAFRLSKDGRETDVPGEAAAEPVDTSKINLNPETPFVRNEVPREKKNITSEASFDDFN